MRVTLRAATQVFDTPELTRNPGTTDAEHLIEFAGRSCYQSWHRPNPKTATTPGYLNNILDQEHFSVLEHAGATFDIEGVSRSLTHELIRHRHLSYSQISQRFVDSSTAGIVIPPAARGDDEAVAILEEVEAHSRNAYERLTAHFTAKGLPRKQAREAARAVLPGGTETSIVVTGNHRAWRDVISKRNAPGADAEIQELASELLRHLTALAPAIYADMTEAGQ